MKGSKKYINPPYSNAKKSPGVAAVAAAVHKVRSPEKPLHKGNQMVKENRASLPAGPLSKKEEGTK